MTKFALLLSCLLAWGQPTGPAPQNPALPGTVTVGLQLAVAGRPVHIDTGNVAVVPLGEALTTGKAGRAEILLGTSAVARVDAQTSLRLAAERPNPQFDLSSGLALIEVLADNDDHPASISMAGVSIGLSRSGLFLLDAEAKTIGSYEGKLRVELRGRRWTIRKGHVLQLALPQISKFDRKTFEKADLFQWSQGRSWFLAKASQDTGQQILRRNQQWWGLGWYWNLNLRMYTFLPSDGEITDAFGATYISPYEEYAPRRPGLASNRYKREPYMQLDRRSFLTGVMGGAVMLAQDQATSVRRADYTVTIGVGPAELAPDRIISTTTYSGQFPGPLLRLKEGQPVTVDIVNNTDTPEQLHWHGQMIPSDVDGSAEEGTPSIPAHGRRQITFTPQPPGFRFYHSHVRAGANLVAGQYTGEVGPLYIEPRQERGRFDREVFLVLKEFEPTLSRGGDMPMNFLTPATRLKELEESGEAAMKASLASGKPHGYEVGYSSFTINGKMLGHGEPVRVKFGDRVLFHILNGSATEIRSLALPGHVFRVIALDGNPVPNPADIPVLWLGAAERISAIVEMNHPGVWIMGDLADDDRKHGMGIVVEYAHRTSKPQWIAPPPSRWSYARFGKTGALAQPDETIDMTFRKDNAAAGGFNRWTINGYAYPNTEMMAAPLWHVKQGKRYRLRMRNASDDIHPIHLHRHTFELTKIAGAPTTGVMKDVVMVGGYQEVEVDFVANNPGLTLFHCHQQIHMDFGFMALIDYM